MQPREDRGVLFPTGTWTFAISFLALDVVLLVQGKKARPKREEKKEGKRAFVILCAIFFFFFQPPRKKKTRIGSVLFPFG
jgi:hypothetical protein